MWLLPVLSTLSRLSARLFYRLTVAGAPVPRDGAVLLVANHPNSLVDPVFLASAARRPVRFLAKAPLFRDPKVGFLVRGSGAIPVYRQVDDPGAMERNEDMFRAAHDALAEGSAVGLFPEGVSHSEPSLMPLKTGAARLALGAATAGVQPFPIIPVGIVLGDRETFRSTALAIVGEPVEWQDLVSAGPDDRDAVRRLTERIEGALQGVTLNLEQWEDEPLVETAEEVWAAETEASPDHADRIARLGRTTMLLRTLRASDDDEWRSLAQRLKDHRRKLMLFGLTPKTLLENVATKTAARWTLGRLPLLAVTVIAGVGTLVFWPPYRFVGWMVDRQHPAPDVRATHKLLTGAAAMLVWMIVLASIVGIVWGWFWGVSALIGLPLIGVTTLWFKDQWGQSLRAVRRFFVLRSRAARREELRAEQGRLSSDLDAINERFPPQ